MAQKVLVVDDEENFLVLIGKILTNAGFEVSTASDGNEALKRIVEVRPDLMILDVNMPELNGFGVCEKVRQTENEFTQMPIIFLTVRKRNDDKVKGLNLGSDDYITKPFSPEELIERVNRVLGRVSSERIHTFQSSRGSQTPLS